MQIAKENLNAAQEMVETFISVGATHFTVIAERGEKEVLFTRKHCDGEITILNLRNDLIIAIKENCNLHIRPYSNQHTLIQLDDCPIKDIFPFCVYGCQQTSEQFYPFLVTETSPNNYQAWISIKGKIKDEIVKEIKKIYVSDPGATGSCRLAGSINYKEKHSPKFPTVNLIHTDKDAVIELDVLLDFDFPEEVGFTQKHRKEKLFRSSSPAPNLKNSAIPWPFYDRALKMAPLKRDNSGVDRSRADYIWSWTALSWGHPIDEVVQKLLRVSPKAKEKTEYEALEYASNTVYSAARNF